MLSGRYRLLEELGSGGMSLVWLAHDEVLGREVAVKVLKPDGLDDRDTRDAVLREAQAAARLSHPHIAGVFDYGESDLGLGVDVPYVVMERVCGVTLSARLAASGPLPCDEALTVCGQVASALAEAHAHGVVHRDVTPSNVMLTNNGAKVVDFGISAVVGEIDQGSTGELLGTPAYVAPERLAGRAVGTAADVYALGVLLYRMMVDSHPWDAVTPSGLLAAHLATPPLPLPDDLDLPTAVRDIYGRCLAKDPADRPTSAELATTLAANRPSVGAAVPAPRTGGDTATMTMPLQFTDTDVDRQRRRWSPPGVKALAAIATVGAVAAAITLLWTPTGTASVPAVGDSDCRLTYTVEPGPPKQFNATIAITQTGQADIADPTLRFTWPGDQVVRAPSDWRQHGRDVTALLLNAGSLAPTQMVQVRLTAAYVGDNTMPNDFTVGACSGATRRWRSSRPRRADRRRRPTPAIIQWPNRSLRRRQPRPSRPSRSRPSIDSGRRHLSGPARRPPVAEPRR